MPEVTAQGYVVNGCPHCDGWHRDEPCATKMCDGWIEIADDPWASTSCKLLAGHNGPCSPIYWDEARDA